MRLTRANLLALQFPAGNTDLEEGEPLSFEYREEPVTFEIVVYKLPQRRSPPSPARWQVCWTCLLCREAEQYEREVRDEVGVGGQQICDDISTHVGGHATASKAQEYVYRLDQFNSIENWWKAQGKHRRTDGQ